MPGSWFLSILMVVLASGCAAQGEAGHFKPGNGLGAAWAAALIGSFGILFPDIAARRGGFDDRSITRLAAGALLLVGSIGLADYYLDLDLVGHVQGDIAHGS